MLAPNLRKAGLHETARKPNNEVTQKVIRGGVLSAMSRSDWYTRSAHWIAVATLLAIAFPLGAFFLIETTYNRAYKDAQTAYSAKEDDQAQYNRCLRAGSPKEVLDCFEDNLKPTRKNQRAEEDVQAQRDMAKATWGMLIASWVIGILSLAVAGIVAYFVRDTLIATRASTEAAVKAAQQAVLANEIAREDKRPWLDLDFKISGPLRFSEWAPTLDIVVTAKNIGKSPATDVIVHAKLSAFDSLYPKSGPGIDAIFMLFRIDIPQIVERDDGERRLIREIVLPGGELKQSYRVALTGNDPVNIWEETGLRDSAEFGIMLSVSYRQTRPPPKLGQTSIVYQLLRMNEGNIVSAFDPAEGDIPADQLGLRAIPGGRSVT